MSALSSVTGLPAADYANEPYAVKQGGKAAQTAYSEGLGFEQVFLGQLTQQLTATLGGDSTDSSSGDSSDSGDDGSSIADSPYSSLLSSALTQGVMSSGGAGGLAMQLAESIDPALAHPTK